jgi:hypothetical protein
MQDKLFVFWLQMWDYMSSIDELEFKCNLLMRTLISNDIEFLLSLLNDKERRIISLRYNLANDRIHTLEEIGDEYSITRERVRQIQNNCIKKMSRHFGSLKQTFFWDDLNSFVKSNGGIVAEKDLEEYIRSNYSDVKNYLNSIFLVLEVNNELIHEHNKVLFCPHFRLKVIKFNEIKIYSKDVITYLESEKKEVHVSTLAKNIANLSKVRLISLISIDKRIIINENKVSLSKWTHINPKSLREKIIYILNKVQEPMHFTKISELINSIAINPKRFSLNAVHNELIKNDKFILIGRGIYASKEWGYKEGSVTDVIESILSKKGPMHLYDITQEVLQRRKVKDVTVKINLNASKSKFRKNKLGLYELV